MRFERRLEYETEGRRLARADSALSELLWSRLVYAHPILFSRLSRRVPRLLSKLLILIVIIRVELIAGVNELSLTHSLVFRGEYLAC